MSRTPPTSAENPCRSWNTPEFGEAVEFEVLDLREVGMLQHQLDQSIAEPFAAVRE